MKLWTNGKRHSGDALPLRSRLIHTGMILLLGIALGTFSKYLDNTAVNELPGIFETLDITNFLNRFSFWMAAALGIAVFSRTPVRAAVNVFVFFAGMVASYYLYSYFIAGFFPYSYAMIWIVLTFVSPVLAVPCWYAKGRDTMALILSVLILAVLFDLSFVFGQWYFEPVSILDAAAFVCGLAILWRKPLKESMIMIPAVIILAVILKQFLPFPVG